MNALDVRKKWMRLMGLDEDEIDKICVTCPPTDINEEINQLTSMFAIKVLNEYRKLEKNA